ncbi:MAG TPA: hypothetical protein VFS58_00855 [Steroidobacteraceae bacterium]|nr:hypothetical protein [Steroidobacteraceae bacterium]
MAQSVPPPRDLWPAISSAIAADIEAAKAGRAVENSPRRARWLPAAGMAAAVALVTFGILIGRVMGPPATNTLAGTTTAQDRSVMIPAALRDADYRKQRDALLVEVQSRLAGMPAADREKVSASLLTLKRSIGEIEAELGRDPANALLQELLVNSCQEEMRALTAVRDSGSQET